MRHFPIASDGWRFIVPLIVVGSVLLSIPHWWALVCGSLCIGLGLFCIYFFRDFNRKTNMDESLIYCPGDGKILEVADVQDSILGSGRIIRIFLSVLDGHVQRSPVDGVISQINYKQGRFYDARNPKAHLENEQNALIVKSQQGVVMVKQIAGLVARRIVCWVKEGDALKQGQRFGLIRFGSQVDLIIPPNTEVLVSPGQRVIGGITILAKWTP